MMVWSVAVSFWASFPSSKDDATYGIVLRRLRYIWMEMALYCMLYLLRRFR